MGDVIWMTDGRRYKAGELVWCKGVVAGARVAGLVSDDVGGRSVGVRVVIGGRELGAETAVDRACLEPMRIRKAV